MRGFDTEVVELIANENGVLSENFFPYQPRILPARSLLVLFMVMTSATDGGSEPLQSGGKATAVCVSDHLKDMS